MVCKYIFPSCRLPFHSVDGFLGCAEAFSFYGVPLLYFCLCCLWVWCHVIARIAVPWQGLLCDTTSKPQEQNTAGTEGDPYPAAWAESGPRLHPGSWNSWEHWNSYPSPCPPEHRPGPPISDKGATRSDLWVLSLPNGHFLCVVGC